MRIRSRGQWGRRGARAACLAAAWAAAGVAAAAEPGPEILDRLDALQQRLEALETENRLLRSEVEALRGQVGAAGADPSAPGPLAPPALGPAASTRVLFSGEAGFGVFHGESEAGFAQTDARIDEARLFLDVMLSDRAFLFGELILAERETDSEDAKIGELYADLEGVPWLSGDGRSATLRVGRFDIPFGEEYQYRDAIDNPLISHSVADFWGIDEGIELYGAWGPADYVAAVQNGGHPALFDGDRDKAVTARIGVAPADRWRASLSAMRTGDLHAEDDRFSELWVGNGFLRSHGDPDRTETFHAELIQADLRRDADRGHLAVSAGYLQYDDDDPAGDSSRDAYVYMAEGVHDIAGSLYGAVRFSGLVAPDGLAVVGQASFDELFNPVLTEEVWRLSLGAGYRWPNGIVVKTEYSIEQGEKTDGSDVEDRNVFSVELALGI